MECVHSLDEESLILMEMTVMSRHDAHEEFGTGGHGLRGPLPEWKDIDEL